jgi:oxygen-independent coproporphyrinogen-3 oxidase
MPGLYLHIPFCRKACHYCDFHFSTTLKNKAQLTNAICFELIARKEEAKETVNTIYFGGGTPSLLSADELKKIFDTIYANYNVDPSAEITLEANPDDLSKEYLQTLKLSPVNRLSIGIQSFREEDLQFMNRAHNASEALQCVQEAAMAGFDNISIDLIYGVPGLSQDDWKKNVQTALSLPIQHLSSYCLTVEEGTALAYKVSKGLANAVNEEEASMHFHALREMTEAAGIPWYEISNFARTGFESKHNSSYWNGIPYMGIGPSAHSFDGYERSWNVSNNQLYIKQAESNQFARETEKLTLLQRIHEKTMTALRTRNGLTASDMRNLQSDAWEKILLLAHPHLERGTLQLENERLSLTVEGLLFADAIAADLFL